MNALLTQAPTQELFGVPIHAIRMAEAVAIIDETISQRKQLQIGVVNVAKIVKIHQDAVLSQAVLTSDLILADGLPLVWVSRWLGQPLPERVAGIDLMLEMLRVGNERGYRVYCLGATDEVLQKATARIARDYPQVHVVGRRNGYFAAHEESDIAADITAARPDILFVAMTSPKKENFLARWSDTLSVPVCHGVGGSFDILAGKAQRAPERWQRLGLEWLYRVKQEPRRLWKRYLTTNTLFCKMVLQELLWHRQ